LFEHAGRFHLLDYKGNFLGEALEDYLPEALQQRMDQQHYGFQALLYAIALERMLRARLPGYQRAQHLGDAWYLFVRAVGASGAHPHAGIWRQRFSDRLLDAADAVLASRTGGTA